MNATPWPDIFCLKNPYRWDEHARQMNEHRLNKNNHQDTESKQKGITFQGSSRQLTSAPATSLRALWSIVLVTFTSLMEQRNASGYKTIL